MSPLERDFRPEAMRALRISEQIVTRGLPFILSLEPLLRQEVWCAELITKIGHSGYDSLDGPSYGLSMLLAVASLLMDEPLPSDFVASATVDVTGGLGPVEGLEDKLFILAGSGLGLKRLLVGQSQVTRARELLAELGSPVKVQGACSASEVFQELFGEHYQTLSERLNQPEQLRRAARKLFHLALDARSPILDWESVERGATRVLERLMPDAPAFMEAQTARQVARRHSHKSAPLDWPPDGLLSQLPRPIRDKLIAQVVQAANDEGAANLEEIVERARASLPPSVLDCYEPQLILRGAIGRALVSLRRHEDARVFLLETVEAWRELGQFEESSHALCELLRVIGILGEPTRQEAVLSLVEQFRASPRLDSGSRAFLHLALGRAYVLVGRPQHALTFLEDGEVSWSATREHVQYCRHRWRARALAVLGRAHEAQETRQELYRAERYPSALFARLDEILETGGNPIPVLERILEKERAPIVRLLTGLDDPLLRAERLSREYPY
ncbi:hypothetical protein BO221_11700 [Archangium sp. Cb G35]|uniref:S16 family serine protease n=1 Tax=Archangium sp. Cb G35 TaxID=1920190 RepID=UPI000936C7F5|nr:S16 family serine protease [Archangium sp. Cb G35]OJT25040.1 hypothetical protein BO221_11700 [Archangium sp. Cb G35]